MSEKLNIAHSNIVYNARRISEPLQVFSEERKLTKLMCDSRAQEFLAGRTCARIGLREFNLDNSPILIDSKSRAPIWPENSIGSISHSLGYCVSIISKRSEFQGLGIDIERSYGITSDIISNIATNHEMKELVCQEWDWGTTIFSIKESIFKCINPLTGIFLDFLDVEITFLSKNIFQCIIYNSNCPFRYVYGYYISEPYVMAIATIPSIVGAIDKDFL